MADQGAILPLPPNRHPAAVQGQRDRLLDAGRALLLFGAATAAWTVGNPDADAAQVFLGFVTWLLGVFLLSFVPVAGRFPQAAALAGAAVANANAVFSHLFTPWN
ncbi:unnamed protein product [Urochloa decumbens]|uniref:Uncharacterized protein n=1 Tax=Urochloa decumbens TaxID=240449 RepID=A0ABC9EB30_9POAL